MCIVLAQSRLGKDCQDDCGSIAQGAARKAAGIEGWEGTWVAGATVGTGPSQQEQCNMESNLPGKRGQRLVPSTLHQLRMKASADMLHENET